MDILDSVYGFFGTGDPMILILDLVVAIILAASVAFLAIELVRIYREYSRKEAPAAPEKPALKEEKKPAPVQKPPEAPRVPDIDVLKGSMADSMKTMAGKYRLVSVTLATMDGLVIASTTSSPEQDAAIYSGLYKELYKVKQEPYYYVDSKDVSLYAVESGPSKVIGVAHRKGVMLPEESNSIREDTKKIVDRFALGGKK